MRVILNTLLCIEISLTCPSKEHVLTASIKDTHTGRPQTDFHLRESLYCQDAFLLKISPNYWGCIALLERSSQIWPQFGSGLG